MPANKPAPKIGDVVASGTLPDGTPWTVELGEPLTEEELRELEDDIRHNRTIPHSVVQAELNRVNAAIAGRGDAWQELTVGELLDWVDNGKVSPAIAALLAAEG
jgi:hypothetical protein